MQVRRIDNDTIIRSILWIVLAVGLIWLAYLLRRVLAWFFGAAFLAVALNPAIDWLSRHVTRKNRLAATIMIIFLVVLVVAFLAYSFVPSLVNQSVALYNAAPHYLGQLQHGNSKASIFIREHHIVNQLQSHSSEILRSISGTSSSVLGTFRSIFSGLVAAITVLALTFFMMLEGPSLVKSFWNSLPASAVKRHRPVADRMYRAVTGYVTGNLLTSLLAAVLTAITLAILSVPFAIPLGILVGLFDLIPLVGATIGSITVIIVALFKSLTAGIVMAIFFIVYQQVENHLLQPLVYSRTIRISPLLVLMSAITGAALGGILGAVVAIPIGACLQIAWEEYVLSRRNSQTKAQE